LNKTIKHILVFLGLVLLQVLILNKINILGYVNPYVFPLFILLFHIDTKGVTLLLLAFALGFIIDLFNSTLGIHTFAMVCMAYLRPIFISFFRPKSDKVQYPSLKENDFSWMLFYIFSMLFIHHLVYFFIEAASFTNLLRTLLLVVLSTIISTFISFLLLFTFKSSK